MLNRTICKRCVNEYAARLERAAGWGGKYDDDDFWDNRGRVICPPPYNRGGGKVGGFSISVAGPPPLGCPFVVEHVVSQEPC